jgi:hypothetical protein
MDKYQQYESNWLACMERIGRKEAVCFEENNVDYTNQIVELNCRRGVMVWVYAEIKKHKKITPIEELDLADKKEMWAFVSELCAGKISDRKIKIEVLKVFYILEYFLNEKK